MMQINSLPATRNVRFTKRLGLCCCTIIALVFSLLPVTAFAADEPRKPPPARSSDVLGERTYRAISAIQEAMSPEDPEDEPDFVEAKELLDKLYERFARLNDFEKSTLLSFYTNYYLGQENIPEALRIYEQMLGIEGLRPDTRLNALRALGQLYMSEENFEKSIQRFNRWRELSLEEDQIVMLYLANAHYNLDNFLEAIPLLITHIQMREDEGRAVTKDRWSLLNAMYMELEDWDNAEHITKQMVTRYDNENDWSRLAAIYSMMDNEEKRIETLALAFGKGYLNESEHLNLSQSLYGNDAALMGARVLEAGMQRGIVEETQKNLVTLSQMYMMASEYEIAIERSLKAAELTETGEIYDDLGYMYYVLHDYKQSADALQKAIDLGELRDVYDTQFFLARTLLELKDYSGARIAATEATKTDRRAPRDNAQKYINYISQVKARDEALAAQKKLAIDFYIP